MEGIEKIICCDRGNENGNPLAMAAMMNGGMNGQWNNPFVYLVWMMFAQRMWGNNWQDGNGGCHNPQIASMQNEMQDNHNADLIMQAIKGNASAIGQLANNLNCDFNTLNAALCDVKAGIQQLGGQIGLSAERVINAVQMGNCNIIQALQNCCCQTQRQIADFRADMLLQGCKDTAELRGGQRDLGVAISQGFSSTAFQAQQDKCDIIRSGQDNTQRIIDTLNNHWSDEKSLTIQDLKNQLAQRDTVERIATRMGNGCGWNNGCGCGCGQ